MTQEEKDLLLKDLCARLPYNVQGVTSEGVVSPLIVKREADWDIITSLNYRIVKYGWKPYLRPMSSMTEEEKKKLKADTCPEATGYFDEKYLICPMNHFGEFISYEFMSAILEWLNAHHFDYRGLIEKGLAIEAPEGMYKYKE